MDSVDSVCYRTLQGAGQLVGEGGGQQRHGEGGGEDGDCSHGAAHVAVVVQRGEHGEEHLQLRRRGAHVPVGKFFSFDIDGSINTIFREFPY